MSEGDGDYREKLRSLGFSKLKGSSRKRDIIDERTGERGGYHKDHWDGRVDATIVAPAIAIVNPSLEVTSDRS